MLSVSWLKEVMYWLKKGLLLLLTYLVCWQLTFIAFFREFNFSFSYELFMLSWTFQSLEKGIFVWVISLTVFFIVVGVFFLFSYIRSGKSAITKITNKDNKDTHFKI